jgi:hypothetical protein
MFNRVKFVINKNFLQTSKNKEIFVKNKKIYNKTYQHFNSSSSNNSSSSIRKFSTSRPPNEPFNMWIIIASISCGSLLIYKKK